VQVIGFAGTDNKGLGGLEIQYNRNLTGKTGKQTIVRDPFGRAINVLSMTPEQQGHDLFTTIDHTIQANAEAVLRQTIAHWHAHSATAVVLAWISVPGRCRSLREKEMLSNTVMFG